MTGHTSNDGSGFTLGQRVCVDDIYTTFEGIYLGLDQHGNARVRDDETGNVLTGSVDFIEALDEGGAS